MEVGAGSLIPVRQADGFLPRKSVVNQSQRQQSFQLPGFEPLFRFLIASKEGIRSAQLHRLKRQRHTAPGIVAAQALGTAMKAPVLLSNFV